MRTQGAVARRKKHLGQRTQSTGSAGGNDDMTRHQRSGTYRIQNTNARDRRHATRTQRSAPPPREPVTTRTADTALAACGARRTADTALAAAGAQRTAVTALAAGGARRTADTALAACGARRTADTALAEGATERTADTAPAEGGAVRGPWAATVEASLQRALEPWNQRLSAVQLADLELALREMLAVDPTVEHLTCN